MEHGQIWAVTIAAILMLQIVSFGVSSNYFIPQAEAQSNFLTYENPIFGIKIQYPSDWENVERPEANLVAFLSPFDSVFDKIQENVVLSYKKSDDNVNLIEASDKIIQKVKKTVTDLTILESGKTSLSGFNAYKSVYTVTLPNGDLQMKQMLVVTIVDEKFYQFIFTSESEKYSNYLPIAQKILDSLVIETDSSMQSEPIKKPQIPDWIKNNAGWWSEGAIGDSDFTSGIQYMIKENIMVIPDLPEPAGMELKDEKRLMGMERGQNVPDWVRNNAGWWADGLISDDDFISGIKYLVEKGIIKV